MGVPSLAAFFFFFLFFRLQWRKVRGWVCVCEGVREHRGKPSSWCCLAFVWRMATVRARHSSTLVSGSHTYTQAGSFISPPPLLIPHHTPTSWTAAP